MKRLRLWLLALAIFTAVGAGALAWPDVAGPAAGSTAGSAMAFVTVDGHGGQRW